MLTLEVEKRDTKGAKAAELLRRRVLPGVVYGAHQPATPLSISAVAFDKVLREAG